MIPSFLNFIDPSYWIVHIPIQLLILQKEKQLAQKEVSFPVEKREGLDQKQLDYVFQNILKHRICLWTVAVITAFFWPRILVIEESHLSTFLLLVGALIGGLIVGWFAMSLKSLPDRYGFLGILITGTMFTAFMSGAAVLPFAILRSGETLLALGCTVLIVLLYIATVLYDFADQLNLGLEPLQRRYFQDPYVRVMEEALNEQNSRFEALEGLHRELLEALTAKIQS